MHGIEFTRLAAAIAEACQDVECIALDDVHLVVRPVGKINVLLLWILGKSDVKYGSIP